MHIKLQFFSVQNNVIYTKCVPKQEHTFKGIVCCLPPIKEVLFHVFPSFPLEHTTIQ